jgi:FKBP-type peptidyl-prolyl cis-trans isomerase FklB
MKSILLCRWLACAILVATGTCAFGQQPPQLKPQLPEVPGIKDPISYALGLNVGSSLRNASFQPSDFDIEQFANGFSDGLAKSEKLTPEHIARNNLEKANEFLKANKEKEGVQTTKSGLQYLVIKAGTGKTPTVTSRVTVHYEGKLLDGTIFDSSIKAGEPAEFRVNEVIPGWTEALQRMKVGDKWRLFIPPGLAYGERGQRPQIGQNELLTFEVELLDVK